MKFERCKIAVMNYDCIKYIISFLHIHSILCKSYLCHVENCIKIKLEHAERNTINEQLASFKAIFHRLKLTSKKIRHD